MTIYTPNRIVDCFPILQARLGSKISLVGQLDIHENKLYVELHNFDFISTNDNQPNITYSTPISSTAASAAASNKEIACIRNHATCETS